MPREAKAADTTTDREMGRGRFATTHWTMVVQAGDDGSVQGRLALEELCRVYWPPLYAFGRRLGMTTADAEDAVQGFFEDLLSRGAIASADISRGRFRTFLISSFRNYCAQQHRFRNRKKRGGGETVLSLDAIRHFEQDMVDEKATNESPEKVFERKWVAQLLKAVLATVRREYASVGKGGLFDELRNALWSGRREVKYTEIAARLETTESAIKSSVHRLKKKIGEEFRKEVTKTVMAPCDVDEEIRYLMSIVSL